MKNLQYRLFYFILASITVEKIFWKTDDLSSKKELFIRCQKSMITLEDIEINENRLSRRCSSKLSLKNLFRCNGLKNICDVDNFETIEKFVDNCIYRSSAYAVCIIYNCVNGKWFWTMNFNVFAFVNMGFLGGGC